MQKLFRPSNIALPAILLFAAFLRFGGLNWDSNFHLHPDERFLTMVGNAMQIPANFLEYFDPSTSKLNPTNINFPFFVYGVFPVVLNKLVALFLNSDNYNGFTVVGRFLSGLVDIFTVLLVYKTVRLLVRKLEIVSLWSAFFYAIAVLPIQLSHFFAVDTFLNFFMFGSFYFILRFSNTTQLTRLKTGVIKLSQFYPLVFSAVFFGLALASKITAVFILPLIIFMIVVAHFNWPTEISKETKILVAKLLVFFFISYIVLRLADPYMFQSVDVFDPRPNSIFLQNLHSLKSFEGKDIWYPPGVQWISKTPTFSIINLAQFGLGLPYFILTIVGMVWIISNLKSSLVISQGKQNSKLQLKNQKFRILHLLQTTNCQLLTILFWVVGFFVYQSFQFVKAMRYFIFIYPFLAIFAGLGMGAVVGYLLSVMRKFKLNERIFLTTIYLLLTTVLLIWPLAFSSIYSRKNSRVAASEWIYQNLPDGSLILSEHWDDALPLSMNVGKQYTIKELPVFAPDDEQKWSEINTLLDQADYYILSSNRGWGSIPTVPEKYPKMTEFYKKLLADKLPHYKKINEFVSYPQLQIARYKLQIDDSSADESFTVYDHPKVLIFQKQ